MVRSDVCRLIANDGTERQVYCDVCSVGMKERLLSREYGLSPTLRFILSDYIEYDGESMVRFNGRLYSVVRTYVNSPKIEITVEEAKALYAPHTVTVYNVREDPKTFEKTVYITVLEGVFLEGGAGASVGVPGMDPTGAAVLKVPLSIKGRDAITGAEREYTGAREYALAADKSALWTADPNRDFFVKGDIVVPSGEFQAIKDGNDNVYRVRSVKLVDNGASELWHLEIGGA